MTDKEIIKALECLEGCALYCRDCSYSQGNFFPICQQRVAKDALGLINRQQEQLEAAIAGQETLQKALAEKDREVAELNSDLKLLINDYDCLKRNFDKTIEKNKRLRDKVVGLTAEKEQLIKTFSECQTEAARALVEKDKEIERLKNELRYLTNERDLFLIRHSCVDEAIDNLADKMAGDTSER